ncbi:hypothetical protein BKA62DRAFT_423321 [Auriculariales sp. MPI-PUGE-AT-0066]|nr:hypothetical protein BKA62DRAFT_423321 [Auriculariales sp. MPI-PUGE-AT-0066]
MTSIAPEILQSIFEELLQSVQSDMDWECEHYFSAECAAVSFTLTAVCKTWRGIAMSMPRLWTYIGIPSEPSEAHISWVDVLLQRSRSAELQVVLHSNTEFPNPDNHAFDVIFRRVVVHLDRWQTASVYVQRKSQYALLQLLHGPAPALRRLVVSAGYDFGLIIFLPDAPKLMSLKVNGELAQISTAFPSLRELDITTKSDYDTIFQLILACSASLDKLWLTKNTEYSPSNLIAPSFLPVALPFLRMLQLMEPLPQDAPTIQLYALEELTIGVSALLQSHPSLVYHAANNITTMTLLSLGWEPFETVELRHITELPKLRHVTFSFDMCTGYGSGYVDGAIFTVLAESAPPIWPELETITLAEDSELMIDTEQGLLDLVRIRCSTLPSESCGARPARLKEVSLKNPRSKAIQLEIDRIMTRSLEAMR